jgi:hypothetical protein
MGWPNIDGPLSFGFNPSLSAMATRKREFVHGATLHDCKAQVTYRLPQTKRLIQIN